MRHGNYMIYRFYSKDMNEYVTEFFTPDKDLRSRAYRIATIASLKEKGYRVAGILYVDKEAYLNARLAVTVEDYLCMENQEREVKLSYRSGNMTSDVAVKTIEMIQDQKWTLLKVLYSQVRRIVRNGYVVENEMALALYDEYLKAIL